MWPHFVNLLGRSWNLFLHWNGTTGLGFLNPVLITILSIAGTLVVVAITRGKDAMKQHWKETTAITAAVTFGVMLLVYGPIFAASVVKTVYDDHRTLAATVNRLQNVPKPTCPTCPVMPAPKSCPAPKPCANNVDSVRSAVQNRLAEFMKEGIGIRDGWAAVTVVGGQKETQQQWANAVMPWHAKIQAYLRTIPRGSVYIARLNGATRDSSAYPTGIYMDIAGHWDRLIVDLQSLDQFIRDPDLGKP